MSKASQLVVTDILDGVALIHLNNPENLNALSRSMTNSIIDALEHASNSDQEH